MAYPFLLIHCLLLFCVLIPAHAHTPLMPKPVVRYYTKTKADKVAYKALGQAEKAYKSAKKAAKKAEKAYRSAAKAAKAARKAHKATIVASWEMVKPKDLLTKLPEPLWKHTKNASSDLVIEFVKKIYKKKLAKMKLSAVEKETWKSASAQIVKQLNTPDCDLFYSLEGKEWAACCRVVVNTQFFGFCPMLSTLEISKSERKAIVKKESNSQVIRQASDEQNLRNVSGSTRWGMTSEFRTTDRWYDVYDYGHYEESVESVYVDLFSVPCYPPMDLGLCSQFCCEPNNVDSVFCNSEMECY